MAYRAGVHLWIGDAARGETGGMPSAVPKPGASTTDPIGSSTCGAASFLVFTDLETMAARIYT